MAIYEGSLGSSRGVSRRQLIAILGEGGAARVIEVFGGARIYVPQPGSPSFARLAQKLGAETARKLCAEFGDFCVTIPARLIATRDQILKLKSSCTAAEIARRLGCSERYVYTVLASER
jgi:hypothetical protein